MKRRELREHIFELLFRIEFNSTEEMPEQQRLFLEELGEAEPKDQEYIKEKYAKIVEKLPQIDELLNEASDGWKVSRMGKVELTILRLAAYEIYFDEDVPTSVAINEAVEMAKEVGGDESPAFINGVRGKLVKAETTEADSSRSATTETDGEKPVKEAEQKEAAVSEPKEV